MEIDEKHIADSVGEVVQAALDGEEIIITRGGEPLVKLAPCIPHRRFQFGLIADAALSPPDFLEPMPEEDLQAWEGGVDENDRGAS